MNRIKLCCVLMLSMLSAQAYASGFQLFEGNILGATNFTAGGAAIANNASTGFFNPAGMTRIHNQQLVVTGTGVLGYNKFSGTSILGTGTAESN